MREQEADRVSEVNKAAVLGWSTALNTHDLNEIDRAVDKYYVPNYVLHDPMVPNFSGGTSGIKQLVRGLLQTLPDLHITIETMIAEGDVVAVRALVAGTQPEGKPLQFAVMSILHFVNGQITEEWELAEATGAEVIGPDRRE